MGGLSVGALISRIIRLFVCVTLSDSYSKEPERT